MKDQTVLQTVSFDANCGGDWRNNFAKVEEIFNKAENEKKDKLE